MANKHIPAKVRNAPMVHIHAQDKDKVNSLASELKILNFDALRIVLMAGFEAIENRTVDLNRIKEDVAA